MNANVGVRVLPFFLNANVLTRFFYVCLCIHVGDYNFSKDYWKPISDEAKDMISNLLVMEPKKRMDATQALQHVWLSKEFKPSDRKPDQTTADAVQDNLINYKDTHALKKLALNVRNRKQYVSHIFFLKKIGI